MKKFRSTERKGFQMTFDNELTISVQWGKENYCDNKLINYTEDITIDNYVIDCDLESDTAEVAIFYHEQIINPSIILNLTGYTSDILGYLSTEQVLDIMVKVKEYDTTKLKKLKCLL